MVKNLPCKAEDVGPIPGQGTRIPHAMEKLGPSAATPEASHSRGPAESEQHNENSCMTRQRSQVLRQT